MLLYNEYKILYLAPLFATITCRRKQTLTKGLFKDYCNPQYISVHYS